MSQPMSGRRAQAARNDQVILDAAREVFVANPAAPIAAVAEHAGVGISALYRRYPSKEELLRKLCTDGLQLYIDVAEQALAADTDPWTSFAEFMKGAVAAESSALTRTLAGTFKPTEELYRMATHAAQLNTELVRRVKEAGLIRKDVEVEDLALIFEQLTAIKVGDPERSSRLRQRYLAIILDSLREPPEHTELPEPAPTADELSSRWG
ncbi:MAG: TetR/AcrR family transcriptional regulator [Micromonosporaceae bacterium]